VNAFDIDVKQLATTQINTGNFLQPNSNHLNPGNYSFDLNISDLTYQFELSVDKNDTTKSIQEKISRLINRSNLGLKSNVITDSLDNTAITMESEGTGISSMRPTIFSIENSTNTTGNTSEEDANAGNLVDILGLNRTSQYPSNAIFSIDGKESSSPSNSFTINKAFQLDLKKVTGSEPVTISLKDDGDAIVDSISQLVDGYNRLVSVTANVNNDKFEGNSKLKREFTDLTQAYNELLQNNGINISEDGSISLNQVSMKEAADGGTITSIFSNLGAFKNVIQSKAENIALNPMSYVNNKIVAYKNPQRSLVDPYNSSAFSGMMFNGYI
jgi:flagellar hook-associated protein 2